MLVHRITAAVCGTEHRKLRISAGFGFTGGNRGNRDQSRSLLPPVKTDSSMKILLFGVAGLIALLLVAAIVFYLAGARMPREHRSVGTVDLRAPRAAVWAAITNYAAMPSWWPAVKSVRIEKLPDGTE